MPRLKKNILQAVLSGPKPRLLAWRNKPINKLTRAERVMMFAESVLVVPEGLKQGQPLKLEAFQEVFIRCIYDNGEITRSAILSMARRNGKSFITSIILLAHLIGPESKMNETLASAANSRDQAALIFRMMALMVDTSPVLSDRCRIVPSQKRIIALPTGSEFYAMSAEAKTGYGRSLAVIVLDEAGQIKGESNEFVTMLETSQGSVQDPLFISISTQSPADGDWLSRRIDDAERGGDPQTVCHVYTAPEEADLMDPKAWAAANPGLGTFRAMQDIKTQMKRAVRLPSEEAMARNLLLNQRVAIDRLAVAPSTWKACNGPVDLGVFQRNRCVAGLDLSSRNDLTACVLCAKEDGVTHTLPLVFCPSVGIEARSRRDRAPYDAWVRDGFMLPVAGDSMDFDQIAATCKSELLRLEIEVQTVYYDKHMIEHFKSACEREGAFTRAEFVEVSQSFKDMGVRLASLQSMLLKKEMLHGNHPALNMAAANAIAVLGREGISALDKKLSTMRIDPLVALVMSAWEFGDGEAQAQPFDVAALIGVVAGAAVMLTSMLSVVNVTGWI